MAAIDGRKGGIALPTDFLKGCLLLLVAEAPSHGYELLDLGRVLLPLPLDGGRVYRQLRALERAGLVTSSWEGGNAGPDRRVYSLTSDGRHDLHRIAGEVTGAGALMDAFLFRLDHRPGRRSAAA